VLLLGWLNLLRYLAIVSHFGILFRIISKMMKDLVIFAVVSGIFVVAFALAFFLILESYLDSFSTWSISITTLLRIIVGDLPWDELQQAPPDQVIVIRLLFFFYLIITAILLLNLLIAMFNKSYSDVIAKARIKYEFERAVIILSQKFELPIPPEDRVVSQIELMHLPKPDLSDDQKKAPKNKKKGKQEEKVEAKLNGVVPDLLPMKEMSPMDRLLAICEDMQKEIRTLKQGINQQEMELKTEMNDLKKDLVEELNDLRTLVSSDVVSFVYSQ